MEPILQSIPADTEFDILSFRNNLNKILGTPYNQQNPWTMHAFRNERNQLILDIQSAEKKAPMSEYQKKCCYAGRHYEKLCVEEPIDGGEYCGVFECKLGDLKMIVGAELDCRKENSYVELKTFRQLETSKDQYVFERFKLLQFWIQSYLVGVPYIQCGFRTRQFHLTKQQWFKTTDLPTYGRKHWDSHVCLNFAFHFLTWLLSVIPKESRQVYKVAFRPELNQVQVMLVVADHHSHVKRPVRQVRSTSVRS